MEKIATVSGRSLSRPAKALAQASISDATKRAYSGALTRFSGWLGAREVSDRTVAEYLTELYVAGKSPATASLAVAAIRFRAGLSRQDPIGPESKRVLAGFRREGRDRGRGQAAGLKWEEADRIAEAAAQGGLAGLRDAAMISIASDAMLRISEVAAIEVGDVRMQGSTGTLHIRSSKTDQEGVGAVLFLGGPTVRKLAAWISHAGIESGPLFRRIVRDGNVQTTALSPRSISRIFSARAKEAGFRRTVSGHSFRVGAAQSLAAAGASVVEMQVAGRWQSPAMPGRYARGELAGRGAVAKFRYSKGQ